MQVVAKEGNERALRACFDEQNRLTNLEAKLKPDLEAKAKPVTEQKGESWDEGQLRGIATTSASIGAKQVNSASCMKLMAAAKSVGRRRLARSRNPSRNFGKLAEQQQKKTRLKGDY